MNVKDEHLALSSGIGLAGLAIGYLYEYGLSAFEMFKKDIFTSIVKPNKTTAVHYFLAFFQDVSEEIHKIKGNIDELDYLYDFLVRTLEEVNLTPELPKPDFHNCTDQYHEECECNDIVEEWVTYVQKNADHINELIIHSAFQIIFRDKRFLHDFHLELSDFIEDYIDDIRAAHPECVTQKNRIRRQRFPKWLTDAVFFRDMGTCSNPVCRRDLSNLLRTQNQIHLDHIVPLDLHGSHDASNFQLLCSTCNTSKGARLTATGSVTAPFWNLE
jgi:hypothetical protein